MLHVYRYSTYIDTRVYIEYTAWCCTMYATRVIPHGWVAATGIAIKPKKAKLEMQHLCIDQTTPRSHILQLQLSAHIEFPQLLELTQKLCVLEDSGKTVLVADEMYPV